MSSSAVTSRPHVVTSVVITAAYYLWTMQRVYLGPEYRGPHPEALSPMNGREAAIAVVLLAMAIALGVYPWFMFDLMDDSLGLLARSMQTGYEAVAGAADAARTALVR